MNRRNQQQQGVYVPRRTSSLAAVLSGQNSTGEQISKMAMDSSNFGSGYAGGWGALAQGLTAGIGAYTQKKEQDQEMAARQNFAQQFPQYAGLAEQLSPESREAISAKVLLASLENNAPTPQSSLGKLAADYQRGLIDQKAYNAAIRKETMFAPDANASGGATGAIIANLRKENPKLSYADALAYAQGLARKGYGYDEQGNVAPMRGLLETKTSDAAAVEQGKPIGEAKGKAIANLSDIEDKTTNAMKAISTLPSEAGFKDYVGAKGGGALPMYLGKSQPIAGTKAADFKSRLDQVQGQQFLEAYNTLKGAGAITEAEGQAATKAMSSMQAATSEKEFIRASQDYQNILQQGLKRARSKAGYSYQSTPQPQQAPQSFNGFKVLKVRDK